MKYKVMLALLMLICLPFGMAATQTDSEKAKNEINQGLLAFKNAQYELAIEHFRQARKLDPESRIVALYLAGALAYAYIPGVDTPDNVKLADEAIETYKQVLTLDPQNVRVRKWLGYLELDLRRLEEAKSYYRQATQAD